MIFYTIYETATGKILFTGTADSEVAIAEMISDGQDYVKKLSSDGKYVQDGQIVDMPPKPSEDYDFDYGSKSWVFDTPRATNRALFKRNTLLADGPDRINPLWWASMTPEQQADWESYRQALLDITDQPGFPMAIDWPSRPDAQKIE